MTIKPEIYNDHRQLSTAVDRVCEILEPKTQTDAEREPVDPGLVAVQKDTIIDHLRRFGLDPDNPETVAAVLAGALIVTHHIDEAGPADPPFVDRNFETGEYAFRRDLHSPVEYTVVIAALWKKAQQNNTD